MDVFAESPGIVAGMCKSQCLGVLIAAIKMTCGVAHPVLELHQKRDRESLVQARNRKTMKKASKTNSQPVHKIRHGAVSASIWRQETEKGPMFNVTFQRAYMDGEAWKSSNSFGRKDLLVVGLMAARAFEWIAAQPRKPASKPDEDGHY